MDEETQVETEEVVPTATPEPSQESDPVQEELDRIEGTKRTKKEKLEFTLNRVKQQLAELGGEQETDENRPVTFRDLQAFRTVEATETALNLIDSEIIDENERKLVKHYLENTIKPSGDAQTDLRNARLMANAVKNRQLAEEATRVTKARTAPSAPSAPPRQAGTEPEFSKDDEAVMRGFGLSKEEAAKALQG